MKINILPSLLQTFSVTSNINIVVKMVDREKHFQIDHVIFVAVSAFNNKVFIHIRYYNGGYPTKYGVCLTRDNWSSQKAVLAYDIGMYIHVL